jgi:carbonic anhydrase/acetyltransferase-like protein (isoleucine patch superfamily)
MGSPAKVVKQLSEVHIQKVKLNALAYVELSKQYLAHYPKEEK